MIALGLAVLLFFGLLFGAFVRLNTRTMRQHLRVIDCDKPWKPYKRRRDDY